jgi:formylglycine-generating enzyme required for sulfatase activity
MLNFYKTFSLLLLLLVQSITAQAQLPPPGTIEVSAIKFVDNLPVTNLMYLEYLNVIDNFETSDYPNFKSFLEAEYPNPDQGILIEIPLKCVDIELEYDQYSDPQQIRKPVLVQNQIEAEKFCEWRSKMVNHLYSVASDHKRNALAGKIKYRLPTLAELKYFRSLFKQGDNYKKYNGKLRDLDHNDSRYVELRRNEFTTNREKNNYKTEASIFRCVCEIKE